MSDVKLEKTNLPESPLMGQSVLPLVDNMKPRVVTTDKENIEKILDKIKDIDKKIDSIINYISLKAELETQSYEKYNKPQGNNKDIIYLEGKIPENKKPGRPSKIKKEEKEEKKGR